MVKVFIAYFLHFITHPFNHLRFIKVIKKKIDLQNAQKLIQLIFHNPVVYSL